VKTISLETPTHGRALLRDATITTTNKQLLVGFHGYAQSAEDMLTELERIPGNEKWTLLSVQALHRFYARGHEKVVASWMTRQDREHAIADNLVYINRVIASVLGDASGVPIVFLGFSQGVAMAYRAAVGGAYRSRCIIAIGGDVPPDVKLSPRERFPAVLLAAGRSDEFYKAELCAADESFLRSIGVQLDVFRYRGGHEWTPELRDHIHHALERFELRA
jgi:predicted esterase